VFLQLEDPVVIHPDPFKNAIAVKQTVIEHADFGFRFVDKLTVNPDLHALFRFEVRTLRDAVKGTQGLIPSIRA
jgi:hypothetical protein